MISRNEGIAEGLLADDVSQLPTRQRTSSEI
jgi:hypothetical protein